MEQYIFNRRDGWHSRGSTTPMEEWTCENINDWLYRYGYRPQAQSGPGRSQVGHFVVWAHEADMPPKGRFPIVIDDMHSTALVWCLSLPDLYDFLAKYAGIVSAMDRAPWSMSSA